MKSASIKRARRPEHMPEIDLSDPRWRILGRGLRAKRLLAISLRVLREGVGKTQLDVAEAAELEQSEVSRIERRSDVLLSTLRRYLRALGGDIEVIAVLPKTGHRIKLDL